MHLALHIQVTGSVALTYLFVYRNALYPTLKKTWDIRRVNVVRSAQRKRDSTELTNQSCSEAIKYLSPLC